jgi:hypothetical protein
MAEQRQPCTCRGVGVAVYMHVQRDGPGLDSLELEWKQRAPPSIILSTRSIMCRPNHIVSRSMFAKSVMSTLATITYLCVVVLCKVSFPMFHHCALSSC